MHTHMHKYTQKYTQTLGLNMDIFSIFLHLHRKWLLIFNAFVTLRSLADNLAISILFNFNYKVDRKYNFFSIFYFCCLYYIFTFCPLSHILSFFCFFFHFSWLCLSLFHTISFFLSSSLIASSISPFFFFLICLSLLR